MKSPLEKLWFPQFNLSESTQSTFTFQKNSCYKEIQQRDDICKIFSVLL